MQIVSNGNNLPVMSKSLFWENKKNITQLSSAELAKRMVTVKSILHTAYKSLPYVKML